jgi:S-adenosylmethionine:tRNA ribosyltransferase-isomerase
MSAVVAAAAPRPVDFELPEGAEATEPPERRGVPRDGVRLLVARPGEVAHHRFRDLPGLLREGDLLVVNTSATLPAALDGVREDGRPVVVHVATPLADDAWAVEPRRPDGRGPEASARAGERIRVTGGAVVRLDAPYPDRSAPPGRLWRAEVHPPAGAAAYLAAHGRPIAYAYRRGDVTLDELQNVYATHPGSAEMASAGRPFTAPLLVALMARGVAVVPVVLHAGVSSPELHEPPAPERLRVPASTARLVAATRAAGGRVVAVGTTVVRALESAVGADGAPVARRGWTDLVLGPDRPARVVDGLVTGLHPPQASHLLLLEAVAGRGLVEAAYAEAVAARYRWHEFGDAMLLLP